jgi:hypothetical protein
VPCNVSASRCPGWRDASGACEGRTVAQRGRPRRESIGGWSGSPVYIAISGTCCLDKMHVGRDFVDEHEEWGRPTRQRWREGSLLKASARSRAPAGSQATFAARRSSTPSLVPPTQPSTDPQLAHHAPDHAFRTRALAHADQVQRRGRLALLSFKGSCHQRLALAQRRTPRNIQRSQWNSLDYRPRL